ncbi:MAG: hypothetical protein FWE62_03190 [Firmicutes bacterium]|nr:hypothetical protein [Bacillota bacterium]
MGFLAKSFVLPEFINGGKTDGIGLTIVFGYRLFRNHNFGFGEIFAFVEQVARENPGFKMDIIDKRSNRREYIVNDISATVSNG